jgi:hypothetical protein
MRTALVLGATLALLAAARPAAAQFSPPAQSSARPEQAVTVTSEVSVYSGPGDGFYPTGKVHAGQTIHVLGRYKDTDWLEIKPPPDSVSYVDARFILPNPKDPTREGFVTVLEGDSLPVYAGSMNEDTEPKVERYKLQRGSIVALVQNRRKYTSSSGTTLVPIGSWPNEVRYVKASALGTAPGTQLVSAVGGQAGSTLPIPLGAAQGAVGSDPLLQQHQRLYQQAQTNPNVDPASRQQALQHLQQAQALLQGAPPPQGNVPAAQIPGHPGNVAASPGYAPGQLVSNPNPQLPQQNTTLYNAGAAGLAPAGMKWSSYGVLQKTAFQIEGKQMYRLLDSQGKPILYASPEPGKTLEPYVGQLVALYGPISYRSDEYMRRDFMTVSYIAPAQPTKAGR